MAGTPQAEELPTKSHTPQQQGLDSPAVAPVPALPSPRGFSYAPGLMFPSPQPRPNGVVGPHNNNSAATSPSAPVFSVSTGSNIPFHTENNSTPVPMPGQLIMPPNYGPSLYPHGE